MSWAASKASGSMIEFALVSATIIVSEWSPGRPAARVVTAMRRNLALIAVAMPILGWIVILPFAHDVGSQLAIFVACFAIVLGFKVAGRRSPDPTRSRSRIRVPPPEQEVSEKRAA
jgi:hypothetical protein